MDELMIYMNKMITYLKLNDYDSYLKEMNNKDEKYSCFAQCYNRMNDNKLSKIIHKAVVDKLEHLSLEYTAWKDIGGEIINYRGLKFCNIDLWAKKIMITHRDLSTIKADIKYLNSRLDKVVDLLSVKFTKPKQDEIYELIKYIKEKSQHIDLPTDEWQELEKKHLRYSEI